MKFGLCSILLTLATLASCQLSPTDDFVLSGAIAYGMMEPDTVAGNSVSSLDWSDDGKYLLAVRMDAGSASTIQSSITTNQDPRLLGEQSIVVYSMRDRKQTIVWKARGGSSQIVQVQWFKGADMALAIVETPLRTTDPNLPNPSREAAIMIDAQSGTAQTVFSVDQHEGQPELGVDFSPAKPFGILTLRQFILDPARTGDPARRGSWSFQYRALAASGSVSPPFGIDSGASVNGWLEDGITPVILRFGRGTDGKIWRDTQAIDVNTGKLTPVSKPKMFEESELKLPIGVSNGSGVLTHNKKQRRAHSWWLVNDPESTKPFVPIQTGAAPASTMPPKDDDPTAKALVAGDATLVKLSPTLSGVAYVSQGLAVVRPIIQMPRDLFLQALKAAERTRIVSNAKQVALGLIMFASDNDDTLPSNQSDIANLIEPYLKNSDLTAGFVYTFGGGLMSDIKSPADTVIGFVPGPGGRAVVYSDGHVKWLNDPAP